MPVLAGAYQQDAEKLARLRVYVASERLARLLNEMFGEPQDQ